MTWKPDEECSPAWLAKRVHTRAWSAENKRARDAGASPAEIKLLRNQAGMAALEAAGLAGIPF